MFLLTIYKSPEHTFDFTLSRSNAKQSNDLYTLRNIITTTGAPPKYITTSGRKSFKVEVKS